MGDRSLGSPAEIDRSGSSPTPYARGEPARCDHWIGRQCREAYFDLRALDLQVDITKRALKSWEDSVRISKLRFEHGDISKLDLNRFEAERAGSAAQLAELEQQVVQQENQLSLFLGEGRCRSPRGLALTAQSMPPDVPPGLPSALLQRRPDIVQAEQELVAATAGIGVAQAQRFPQFALTGTAGVAGFQLTGMSGVGPFGTFGASAAITGPLLNATALGYQVQVAEAQTKGAVAQYQKKILTAFKEVEDALIAVQKSRERAEAQEQQVQALQSLALRNPALPGRQGQLSRCSDHAAESIRCGVGPAKTRRAQLVLVVQLYKALGGGWSPAAPAKPESTARFILTDSRRQKFRRQG